MRFKVIHEKYMHDTNTSLVGVETRDGKFYGRAKCHPDDLKHKSVFLGMTIAQLRAVSKAYKADLKNIKIQAKTLNNYYSNIKQLRSFDDNNYMVVTLRREIERLNERRANCERAMDNIDYEIKKMVKDRDIYYNTKHE